MKSKRRWLLFILPLALFAWAYQAASWRPKLVGVQPTFVSSGLSQIFRGFSASAPLLVSPDGKLLASTGSGNNSSFVTLWDPVARQQKWQIKRVAPDEIGALAFSPDGRSLAVVVNESKFASGRPKISIHMVETATGKERHLLNIVNNVDLNWQESLQSATFLSDRELVVSTTQGASVVDTQTGKMIRQWKFELPVIQVKTRFRLGGQSHVAADGSAIVVLDVGIVPNHGIPTPNGNHHDSTVITIYDAKTGKARGTWTYSGVFRNPRLSPDGTLWAMNVDQINLPSFYDARTGKQLVKNLAYGEASSFQYWGAGSSHIVSPTPTKLAILDARNAQRIRDVPGNLNARTLALDARGDYYYTLDNNGKIWRWRLR